MAFFELFLQFVALLLSVISLVLVYMAVNNCRESQFVPIYYFTALTFAGIIGLSVVRLHVTLLGWNFSLSHKVFQDLFLSYIALFLFGSLWQSYEAEMCIPTFVDGGKEN